MSPFHHNIRALRKAYKKADTPELKHAIHFAAIPNNICHINKRQKGALDKIVPIMERDMKAAGVQPVPM